VLPGSGMVLMYLRTFGLEIKCREVIFRITYYVYNTSRDSIYTKSPQIFFMLVIYL
jgi:hypothetical protein